MLMLSMDIDETGRHIFEHRSADGLSIEPADTAAFGDLPGQDNLFILCRNTKFL